MFYALPVTANESGCVLYTSGNIFKTEQYPLNNTGNSTRWNIQMELGLQLLATHRETRQYFISQLFYWFLYNNSPHRWQQIIPNKLSKQYQLNTFISSWIVFRLSFAVQLFKEINITVHTTQLQFGYLTSQMTSPRQSSNTFPLIHVQ